MDYLPLLLQQEFNKYYTDIVNCDITHPPYYTWRVPHTFFLRKRWGFSSYYNYALNVEDFIVFNWVEYWLVKSWANLLLKQWWTTLWTYTYNSNLNQKFKIVTSVNWTMSESWSWANWDDTTPWVFKLVDSSKTWTVNAYAGKYVYMDTWTIWAWQVWLIQSNTATELVLANWWTVKPSNVAYKIFASYWECLWIITWDWFYIVHNSTNILKVDKFGIVKDLTVFKWKIFYVNNLDYVWYSDWWAYWNTYVSLTSPVWNIWNILNIDTYQNYVLLFKSDWVYLIDEKTITVSWSTSYDYKINLLTNLFWLLNRWAYTIYNQWVHMVTSVKKFIALSITPAGTDKYTVEETNEWIYIQKFLDTILSSDVLWIWIIQDRIVVTHKTSTLTNVYIYDFFYKWWHRWTTDLNIYWVKTYWDFYYIWDKVYKINLWLYKDEWNILYNQSVKSVVWEDNVFSIKKFNFTKFYIWSDTTKWTYVNNICYLWWLRYEDIFYFENSKWLTDKELVNSDWTLWSTILWNGILWWYSPWYLTSLLYADIWTIEIPLWYDTELGIIEIVAEQNERFVLWWVIVWYELIEPQVTPLNNVLISD